VIGLQQKCTITLFLKQQTIVTQVLIRINLIALFGIFVSHMTVKVMVFSSVSVNIQVVKFSLLIAAPGVPLIPYQPLLSYSLY